MTKPSIAVVGAKGYIGSALCAAIEARADYRLVRVTRENYAAMQAGPYDILVNAAMPSKRFWAKNHPREDFAETVEKTADLLNHWRYGKFVQVSTISARSEPDSVYGRNKAAAEELCEGKGKLIVRLSSTYAETLSKGALMDILHGGPVYVSGESRYCFAPLAFVTGWMARNFHREGISEVGARNSVRLDEIARHLGKTIRFEGPVECQEVLHPEPDFPDARDVFKFMETLKVPS